MSGGYGPPLLDFSPLGNLGKTFFKARDQADERAQKQEIRQSLASLGNGTTDYDAMGRKLLSMGDVSNGIGFLKLAQDEKTRQAQTQASQGFSSSIGSIFGGGNTGAQSYGTTSGTPRASIEGNVHVAENEDDVARLERATGQYLTAEDQDKITRTAYGEAGNEGPVGQAAVAGVIANRARQSGMTPSDVVMAKGQFEPWSDPNARLRMENLSTDSPVYQRIASAAVPVVQGNAPDPTGGADHFYAPKAQASLGRNAPAWDDGTGQDIGNHRFFSKGYRPGGNVQVAQADIPASGAQDAQYQIPGQAARAPATPQSRLAQSIPQLIQAAGNPNLPEGQRQLANTLLTQALAETKASPVEKEYAFAQTQGFNGTLMEYKLALKKAGATNINNNVGGDAIEPEFNKETGKAIGKRFDAIAQEGDTARSDLAMVDQLRSLGGSINFKTMPALRGALAEYGVKVGDDVGEIQAYNSIIDKLTPAQRIPGSGASSDLDVKMFKGAMPRLINTPEGSALIMDTMQAMGEDRIARAVIAERAQTGELTPAQAIKELRALPSPFAAFKERLKTTLESAAGSRAGAPSTGQPEKPQARQTLPQGYSAGQALSEAKQAIASGKDRAAVAERLKSYGIDPARLD